MDLTKIPFEGDSYRLSLNDEQLANSNVFSLFTL